MSCANLKRLSTQHVLVGWREIRAVIEAARNRDLSGNADIVGTYEQALARCFGSPHAVACSSGTAAIHLALLALDVATGDEVIVPATAPVMTALPVLAVGARPIFADVASPHTFALDLRDVGDKITRKTCAVISVPMWGYPSDGPELVAACRRWEVPLIEDAAQAHGTTLEGRRLGTQGLIGTFSTHARKLICTGEGGFCLTDDLNLAARLSQLRSLGRAAEARGFGGAFGLNYKLPALSAALGLTQLTRLDQRLATRRRIAGRLTGALGDIPGIDLFPVHPYGSANFYAMLITAAPDRASQLGQALLAEGVESDTLRYDYRPLYEAPIFRNGTSATLCPNAERLCSTLLTLPCHEGVITADIDRIVGICRKVMGS